MDGGAWWAAVPGVAVSQAQLSGFTFTFHFHALEKEMATHSSGLAWRISGKEGNKEIKQEQLRDKSAAIRRKQWHPTPGLLPGKSYGQRSLEGCSPWVAEGRTRLSGFTFSFMH